jgi:hypothetical protein
MDPILVFIYRQDLPVFAALRPGRLDLLDFFYSLFPDETKDSKLPPAKVRIFLR